MFIVDVDGDKIPSTDFRLNYILNSKLSPSEIALKIRDLAAKRKAERAELSLLNASEEI